MTAYNAKSIKVLEGLEAVRKRPGMYIGSTNTRGLHHLVWEILDNAVDEHLAGYCDEIDLIMNKNGSISIRDNGRGIPVEMHESGMPAIRLILTTLHAGGKFDGSNYKVSGGLHGVGSSVVNALSSYLEAEIVRDGFIYTDKYKDGGKPDGEISKEVAKRGSKTGTKITFMPDDTIFETLEFKADIIKRKLKETAFLNKGLKLNFVNEIEKEEISFFEPDGIVGYIKDINKTKDIATKDVIYLNGISNDIYVEFAIQYTKDYSENILSFCNNINTIEGGTHVSGFKSALTRVLNQYAREIGMLKEKDPNLEGRDVRNGISAIVLLKHKDPQYEGQTKTKLGNTDARGAVDEILSLEISKYFDRNVEVLKEIIEIALRSQKIRKAEDAARDNILNKTTTLMSNRKLAACRKKNPDEIELILVEGDSAGGSAKQGRDREIQAILPQKGKILNIEKQNIAKALENEEIATLISVLGCGFSEGYGNDFNIDKLKYGKIIILTDADVDGRHITTLLLTLFYRYMPELIYEGKVFIGMPPLYRVKQGKNELYLYDESELKQIEKYFALKSKTSKDMKLTKLQILNLKKLDTGKTYDLQRYKGLGEMNPDQLWDTTLNPETRYLKEVNIADAAEADNITNILMGTKVPPRRDFIYEEAINADIDL